MFWLFYPYATALLLHMKICAMLSSLSADECIINSHYITFPLDAFADPCNVEVMVYNGLWCLLEIKFWKAGVRKVLVCMHCAWLTKKEDPDVLNRCMITMNLIWSALKKENVHRSLLTFLLLIFLLLWPICSFLLLLCSYVICCLQNQETYGCSSYLACFV